MPGKIPDMDDVGIQFGMISSLRTGNVVIDMIVSMCVPLFFQLLDFFCGEMIPGLSQFIKNFTTDSTIVRKVIEHEVNY